MDGNTFKTKNNSNNDNNCNVRKKDILDHHEYQKKLGIELFSNEINLNKEQGKYLYIYINAYKQ